jgi:tripartite-type tricarboxylate transporter receptor subunit TctC
MIVSFRVLALAGLPAIVSAAAHAQTPSTISGQAYPTKSVRILVGFTAGAGMDIAVRLIAPKMGEVLGQSVIIDNRPGAGGNLAAELVARAPADGYTLLTNGAPAAISQTLYTKLGYDLLKDLEAVALIASVPQLMVVHPSLPVKSARDFVAMAKLRQGELTYATTGSGSTPHLSAEMLGLQAGIRLLHIPYRGSPQALTDLMAGNVSLMFANLLSVLPHIQGNRLRALAITSAKRSPITPAVPTVGETYAGFESGSWYGLYAPAGTPKEAVMRLNEAASRALQSPEVRDKFIAQGAELLSGTPQDTAAYTRAEVVKWSKVVKASGARVD